MSTATRRDFLTKASVAGLGAEAFDGHLGAGKVVQVLRLDFRHHHLADDIGELLMSKYGVKQVLKRRKRAASVPAPDAVYKEYAEQCDLVITGSGD